MLSCNQLMGNSAELKQKLTLGMLVVFSPLNLGDYIGVFPL